MSEAERRSTCMAVRSRSQTQEEQELVHLWKTRYQQQSNNIKDAWNENGNKYEESIKKEE